MSQNKIGAQSFIFRNPISITETACIVGPKEGEGPLAGYFDIVEKEWMANEKTWEKAESAYMKTCLDLLLSKAALQPSDIDVIIAGDLLNQSTSSTFGARDSNVPYLGIFGACSTFGEGLGLSATLIDGGFIEKAVTSVSSHYCTAEKTFRLPLELGTQRAMTASWTVSGNGSVLITSGGNGPFITGFTPGKIVDMGMKNPSNMGAAMAPAAADTILNHLSDFCRTPDYYDMIVTGDLGSVGSELLIELCKCKNVDISKQHNDCGVLIFDANKQDTHAGGSGCACSAVTFSGYLYKQMKNREIDRILFVPTGALMSTVSNQQGESIPAVAHAVVIESARE